MAALDFTVRSGRALYVGISTYTRNRPARPPTSCAASARPASSTSPYNMFDRWVEDGLLDVLAEEGIGCIAFSPLDQGFLTDKYLRDIPEGSRAEQAHGQFHWGDNVTEACRQGAQAERVAPSPRPVAWRRWPSPGCCATQA